MGVKRLPKTNEFVTIDEIGNCVLIIEYTEMIAVDSVDGGPTEVPGVKHYMTAANETVTAIGNGSFTIPGKDILLRRLE